MKTELVFLLWTVALAFVQMLIAAQGAFNQVGLMRLIGNRDDMPALTGWAGRAQRAQRNMLESLPLFAALVLIAVLADKTGSLTHLGVQLFFWGRMAYAVVYLVGLPWVRTGVWAVSVAGLIVLFTALV